MPRSRILRNAFFALLFITCFAGTSWWLYVSYTFVPFEPLTFDNKKGLVATETEYDFYKNLPRVLDYYHIVYKFDGLNHPLIPLNIARDKELVWNLTTKAQDIIWLYDHINEEHPSYPCQGDDREYRGYVFGKENAYHIGGDSTVDIDLTCEDIKLAEQILKTQIAAAGGMSNWHIRFELPEYYRQYFGYRNAKGEVVVYINCLLNSQNPLSGIRDHLRRVEDGGSAYWQVTVNLSRRTIENLSVNGVAVFYRPVLSRYA